MVQHLFKLDTRLALPFVRFEGPEIPIDVSQFCTMRVEFLLHFVHLLTVVSLSYTELRETDTSTGLSHLGVSLMAF